MGDAPTGWSVRSRILATILVVAALGLVAAGGTAYLVGRQEIIVGIDQRLNEQVAAARMLVLDADTATLDSTRPARRSRGSSRRSCPTVIRAPSASSTAVRRSSPASPPRSTSRPIPRSSTASSARWPTAASASAPPTTDLGGLRYIAVPGRDRRRARGLRASPWTSAPSWRTSTSAIGAYALVAGGVILIIGLIGWLVAGRLLAPIRRLRLAAEDITATDRGHADPGRRP